MVDTTEERHHWEEEVVVEGCHTVGCCVGIVVDQVNDFVVSLGKRVGLKWEKKGGDGEDGEEGGDDKMTKYLILGVVGSIAVHIFMAGFFYSRQMLDLLYNMLEVLYFIPYIRLIVMVLVGIVKWVGVGVWELAKEERKRAEKRRQEKERREVKKQQKEMSEETKNISEQLLKMMEKEEEVRRDAANAEQIQMKLLQGMMARLQKLEKG